MGKRTAVVFLICWFSFCIIATNFPYPWIIYPTKSSPQTLSFVCHSGFYPNKPIITLKYYKNDVHIRDYTLIIKDGVLIEEPQSYELPHIGIGKVEANVALGDEQSSRFTKTYNDTEAFYQRGLLLYMANYKDDGNLYMYFVSGKEKTCYNKEPDFDEWKVNANAPSPSFIPHKGYMAYVSIYSGWKENRWVVNDFNN